MTRDEALRKAPGHLIGGYDPWEHKTADDIGWLVLREVDLYDEGEETEVKNERDRMKALRFVKSCGTPKPTSYAPRGWDKA